MQDFVFKPRYTFKGLADVILISLGLLFVSVFSWLILGFSLQTSFAFLFMLFFCFWWMHNHIRYIAFYESRFTVAKYIWVSKTISYIDITDIGNGTIKTKRGNINIAGMSNTMELLFQFKKLMELGKIDFDQLEKKIFIEEIIVQKSILPSIIASLPFWALLFYYWPYFRYWFSSLGLVFLSTLIFFIVASIARRIIKRLMENGKLD
jgi:hypothetical protein